MMRGLVYPNRRRGPAEIDRYCRHTVEELSVELKQLATELANATNAKTEDTDRPEREFVREPAELVRRRGGGCDRPRAFARLRPLVVADRAYPADRHLTCRDCIRELLDTWTSPTATSWVRWRPT